MYTSIQVGILCIIIAFLQDSVSSHYVGNQSSLSLRISIYSLKNITVSEADGMRPLLRRGRNRVLPMMNEIGCQDYY